MANRTFYYVIEDRLPQFEATCLDANGAVVDISSSTATLNLRKEDSTTTNSYACTIATGTDGVVTYAWLGTEITVAGRYHLEVEVTFASGKKTTFPNFCDAWLEARDDLD